MKTIWNFDEILQRIENGEKQMDIAKDLGVQKETLNRKICGYRSALKDKAALTDKELVRIAKARHNLVIDRKITNLQKQIINKDTTNASKIQMLKEVLLKELNPFKKEKVIWENTETWKKEGTIHYLISDTHYIDEELTPIEGYLNKIFPLIRKDININKPKKIHLVHLGDFIEGRMHRSQDFETKTTMMKQVVNVAQLMIRLIEGLLLTQIKQLDISLISNGNHDELNIFQPRDSRENITYLINEMLMIKFKKFKNVRIKCAPRIYYKDNSNVLMFTHLFSRNANPRNVSQFTSIINDNRYKKHFDYSFTGHNHLSYQLDFKGKHYKHYGVSATKLYDNDWEKANNMFSTKGMSKFKIDKECIEWINWYF